jgi:hypothetical protein
MASAADPAGLPDPGVSIRARLSALRSLVRGPQARRHNTKKRSIVFPPWCGNRAATDILSGRVALWRMDQRFEHIDLEMLLGKGVQAGWFYDNRLGRALDHIDEVGTDTLLSGIVLRDLRGREAEPFSVHLDHTTLSLYGVYETDQQPTPAHGSSFRPTRGPPAGPRALLHEIVQPLSSAPFG